MAFKTGGMDSLRKALQARKPFPGVHQAKELLEKLEKDVHTAFFKSSGDMRDIQNGTELRIKALFPNGLRPASARQPRQHVNV